MLEDICFSEVKSIDCFERVTAGKRGWSPFGVSAVTLKWPVKAGPTEEGRESGST